MFTMTSKITNRKIFAGTAIAAITVDALNLAAPAFVATPACAQEGQHRRSQSKSLPLA
jgi:hypothetical protein